MTRDKRRLHRAASPDTHSSCVGPGFDSPTRLHNVGEPLTNALKHARATHADVTVRYGSDELQIEIRDDGRGTATTDGLGNGLAGIRERVKIYGGEMTAGAVNGGGFVLSTRLPISGERS
jgi:signal transduction histidine kinase